MGGGEGIVVSLFDAVLVTRVTLLGISFVYLFCYFCCDIGKWWNKYGIFVSLGFVRFTLENPTSWCRCPVGLSDKSNSRIGDLCQRSAANFPNKYINSWHISP